MKPTLLLIVTTLLIAACAPASTPTPTTPPPTATLAPTENTSPTEEITQSSESVAETDEPAAEAPAEAETLYNGPAWANLPLTDARTGETFTFADFAGKTVYVEPMATWCTNCRRQLPNVEAARQQLDPEQYVFIGLSVAEQVDNTTLANYVNEQGWNFPFAVASTELTQGMVDSFGRTVITPPSTPHFIIRPDGSLSQIRTGSHSTEAIIADLQG
jgi:thiol-disulfide isomerase/thioredoxin